MSNPKLYNMSVQNSPYLSWNLNLQEIVKLFYHPTFVSMLLAV